MRLWAGLSMVGVWALFGCGPKQLPLVTANGAVASTTSAPRLERVRDLGSPRLRPGIRVPGEASDGVAAVGELVLLTGDDFGRRPKVTVSGMVAQQVARTDDGGIVIRVPWGVRTGNQPIEVSTPEGKSSRPFPIRRYALATVPSRDRIYVLDVTRKQVSLRGEPLQLPNAHRITYCGEGQTAYVGGQTDKGLLQVAVVDMAAAKGPRISDKRVIPGDRLVALTAADHVPVAIAISDTYMLVLDTRDPLRPTSYRPRPLPKELEGKIQGAAMSPDGTLLALIGRQENQVLLYEVVGPEAKLTLRARSMVIPKSRTKAAVLRALRFAADSSTLWILSGDTARSRRHGRFPLRLTALKIMRDKTGKLNRFGVLSMWRSIDVPHRAAPVALAVARGQPTVKGTTVSIPPKDAAVFITAHDAKLLTLARTRLDRKRGLRHAVRLLAHTTPLGTLVKTDINGKGGPMFTSPALLGPVAITSDSQVLLVAGARVETQNKPARLRLVYGITARRAFGKQGTPRFIELAQVDPETLKRPFQLGAIQVQP